MATGGNSLEVQDSTATATARYWSILRSVYIVQKSGTDYVQTWSYPFETAINTGISAVASGMSMATDIGRFSSAQALSWSSSMALRAGRSHGTAVLSQTYRATFPARTAGTSKSPTSIRWRAGTGVFGADSQYGFPTTGRIYVFDARSLQLKWKSDDLVLGDTLAVVTSTRMRHSRSSHPPDTCLTA